MLLPFAPIEKITLDIKRQMFTLLVKKHNADFVRRKPKFLPQLEDIVPHRNVFAHLELVPLENIEVEQNADLVFKKYANGKYKPKIYKRVDVTLIVINMYLVNKSLDELLQEMPPLV
jgi:hypothetical protein